MIIAASICVGRSRAPVEGVAAKRKGMPKGRNSWHRLVKLFVVAGERKLQLALPRPLGHLKLVSVTAGPPQHSNATLHHISFEALPGEVVGVVGPSAAGKSSLARVITGVWPPSPGHGRLYASNLPHS